MKIITCFRFSFFFLSRTPALEIRQGMNQYLYYSPLETEFHRESDEWPSSSGEEEWVLSPRLMREWTEKQKLKGVDFSPLRARICARWSLIARRSVKERVVEWKKGNIRKLWLNFIQIVISLVQFVPFNSCNNWKKKEKRYAHATFSKR